MSVLHPVFQHRLVLVLFLGLGTLPACGGRLDSVSDAEPARRDEGAVVTVSADPNDVWLAFDASDGDGDAVYRMRADGSQRSKLEIGMSAHAPAFSADGRSLAFSGPDGIWIRDLSSGANRRLTSGTDDVPAWSPDGRTIAFTRDVDIYTISVDGTDERLFIKGPPPGQAWYANYGHPVFTKDGQSLLFDRRGAIEMGDVDGQNVRPLFESGEDIMMTTVSPDGAELVISAECGVHRVKLADAAHACTSPPLGSGAPRSRPAWSSGGLVAFADGWYTIHVVPANGGEDKTVLDTRESLGGRYVAEVAWSVPGSVVR